MSLWSRIWYLVGRELLARPMPHGLVNWRYLFPTPDDQVRLHRTLWLNSLPRWPRPAWVMLQGLLWLRWIFAGAWLATWRPTRSYRPPAGAPHMPMWRMRAKLLRLALAWCVPPAQAMYWGMTHRRDEHGTLGVVFRQEVLSYHRLQNASDSGAQAAAALLQDKWRTALKLAGLGVPMAPTLALTARHSDDSLGSLLPASCPAFCKTRHGHHGLHAFSVDNRAGGWNGRSLAGSLLPDLAAIEAAWRRLLSTDDALVQPLLINHPELADLAPLDTAITVRIVTRRVNRGEKGHEPWLTLLEVPDPDGNGYLICPAYPRDGADDLRLGPPLAGFGVAEASGRSDLRARLAHRSAAGWWLPCGPEMLAHSVRAHAAIGGLWAVAWDWVITPEGPLLLEGNANFSLEPLQLALGGLAEAHQGIPSR